MKQHHRVRLAGSVQGATPGGGGRHGWAPHLHLSGDDPASPPCFAIIAALHARCPVAACVAIDVGALATAAAPVLRRPDPIVSVQTAELGDIDGVLYRTGTGGWTLLHQASLPRAEARFVQGWLLGCYALQGTHAEAFECRRESLYRLADDDSPAALAYSFAARLTMPPSACRMLLAGHVDGDALVAFAARLQVPLLHAARRWLARTAQKAALVLDENGAVHASWVSETACSAGWRIEASGIARPGGRHVAAAATDALWSDDGMPGAVREGRTAMADWFAGAPAGGMLRQASLGTVGAGQRRFGLTLLQLPRDAVCPPPPTMWPQYRRNLAAC